MALRANNFIIARLRRAIILYSCYLELSYHDKRVVSQKKILSFLTLFLFDTNPDVLKAKFWKVPWIKLDWFFVMKNMKSLKFLKTSWTGFYTMKPRFTIVASRLKSIYCCTLLCNLIQKKNCKGPRKFKYQRNASFYC